MTAVFLLGVTLLVLSVVLVGSALGPTARSSGVSRSLAVLEAMASAPAELTTELQRPFGDRVLAPLQARVLRLARRVTGAEAADRIRHRLDLAGNPPGWTVDRVLSGKVLGAALGLVAGGVASLVFDSIPTRLVVVVVFVVVGFFAPNLYLYQKAYDRSERMQRDLPDAIDLLTISVESGLGFDAALQQVARHTDGPLAEELSRVLREMQIGQSRSAALRGLSERTGVTDVRTFVGAMVQADAFGIPIAQVLRIQSSEIRVKRRQRAEEKAQQVPVKITVPLVFCILPTLFVAVGGPAVLTLIDSFGR